MFSNQRQELIDIFLYYDSSKRSLNYYRKGIEESKVIDNNYIGYTRKELIASFQSHLVELEKNICLNILSAIEARFRVDYQIRVKGKYKDNTSKKFREIYKLKEYKAYLEQDILNTWKQENQNFKNIISEYIGTLKYRHLLAHGRYWTPKLGRNYDIATITLIANRIYANIPLKSA